MIIVGIDPGMSGGIAVMAYDDIPIAYKMPETERDIYDILEAVGCEASEPIAVFLESVHSMPGQGVASSFKFGRGYGFLRGAITALKYPLYDVTPQKWQKALSCLTRGDKHGSNRRGPQLVS